MSVVGLLQAASTAEHVSLRGHSNRKWVTVSGLLQELQSPFGSFPVWWRYALGSVVISRPWSRDSSSFCPGFDLETWWPRSWSWDRSWSQDSMLGAYACSTITVICSTFKRVLCHRLELMQLVLWSGDMVSRHECIRVHFVQVSVSVSRPDGQGLGLET